MPHRKNPRLSGRDYGSGGAFFITISSYKKQPIFGRIIRERNDLSEIGLIVANEWLALPMSFAAIHIDEHVVMPNHFHGIVVIDGTQEDVPTLGTLIRYYKSKVTLRVKTELSDPEARIWHRSYNDRIIRQGGELDRIRQYIRENPSKWPQDEYNPQLNTTSL